MGAQIIKCIEFNDLNDVGIHNKIFDTIIKNKNAVVIAETRRLFFLKNMFYNLLSNHEKSHCNNLKFENLKDRYSIHRGILRIILLRLTNRKNSHLHIAVSPYGKPFIEGSPIKFNLSHSANFAIYAFSLGTEIGIDIEEEDGQINIGEIAPLVLSAAERVEFKSFDCLRQKQEFYKLWTRKEAVTKNYGLGMSMDFKEVHLGFNSLVYKNLRIYDLSVANTYYAAMAL